MVELAQGDRPGLGVLLVPLRQLVLKVPDRLRRFPLGEEEQIGADAGVGVEDAVGQPDDGVEVAALQQPLLDARLDALAEERAVGQDDGRPAAVFQRCG